MSKFVVGEMVRVRRGLYARDMPDGFKVLQNMERVAGQTVRIAEHKMNSKGESIYHVSATGASCWYKDFCLKGIPFTWEKFRKGEIQVKLTSQQAHDDFMKAAEKQGLLWNSGLKPTSPERGYIYGCVSTAIAGGIVRGEEEDVKIYEWFKTPKRKKEDK